MTGAPAAERYRFSIAGADDDADLRTLLRDNPIGGWIRLSLERDPNVFAAGSLYDRHAILVARCTQGGRPAGLCEYGVRRMHVAGEVRAVPYLGALRVDARHRHRIALLKEGFEAVRTLLRRPSEFPTPLTSVTADNAAAQRLLGAGLPGMPRYVPAGMFTTLALATRGARFGIGIGRASADDLPDISALLERSNRERAFAPQWLPEDLAGLARFGLPADRFLVCRRDGRIRGCVAVWDQRGFKQTRVHGYSPWVRRMRPIHNAVARLLQAPALPAVGDALDQVYLSHRAIDGDDPHLLRQLVAAGRSLAHSLDARIAVIGAASAGREAAVLRRLPGAREYRSQLYTVRWDEADLPPSLDDAQPDIALL